MVKQTKKGSIGKKALSAILAASMIMTSSSFVMAGPVVEEVEAVAVEEASAVDAEVVEETDVNDELARKALTKDKIKVVVNSGAPVNYNGQEQRPAVVVQDTTDPVNPVTINPNQYTLTYSNNKDAGIAKVTVTFNASGEYNGSETVNATFEIAPLILTAANTTVKYKDNDGFVFDGTKKGPEVESVVYNDNAGGTVTLDSADYEIKAAAGSDMKSAGDQTVYVALKSDCENYTADPALELGKTTYKIDQATFNSATVKAEAKSIPYGASDAADYITVTNIASGEKVDDTEYTVTYTQNGKAVQDPAENMGTYIATITSNGHKNYKANGTITTNINVVAKSLAAAADNAEIKVDGTLITKDEDGNYTLEYTGETRKVTDVTIDGAENEFEVDLTNVKGKNAGDVLNIVLTGKNTFAGQTATIPVKIVPKKIETATKEGTVDKQFGYTAKLGTHKDGTLSKKAIVELWYNDGSNKVVLEEGKDYTYTTDTTNKKVVITGIGNYTTETEDTKVLSLACEISTKLFLADESITATVDGTYSWISSGVTPSAESITLTANGTKLVLGKDYTVKSYGDTEKNPNNTNAGTGYIVLEAVANSDYAGERVVTFNIAGKELSSTYKVNKIDDVKLDQGNPANNKKAPIVTNINSGAEAPSANFRVEYYKDGEKLGDNDQIRSTGKVTVKVIGQGQYTGELETSYQVLGTDINTVIVADAIADQKYTGSAITPSVVLKDKNTSAVTILELGKDYTISYQDNVDVGTAAAVIKGIGNYSGTILVSFNIIGQMNQTIEVLPAQAKAIQSRTLNDKATKVKFTTGKGPKTAVTYTSSNEDVVTVDAEGNIKYTGLGEATITIKAEETEQYKAAEATMTVKVGLKQPTFSPSSKNDAFTVTTSTVKGAEKFQVQYVPTGKSFTSKAAKSKTFTVDNKLKKGRISAANKETYRVRVRAINGDTKSKWSPVKTIATK